MKTTELFSILDSVDSTNNYAMAKLHAGLANHGMAWFALEQTAGKGQRGRKWISAPCENIALSVVIEPSNIFLSRPFAFNAVIVNACYQFLNKYATDGLKIKWPNDMFIGDRKAGGILIENTYQGKDWKWAVVGIGININQSVFPRDVKNPVSLKQITGFEYDPITLAKALHKFILDSMSSPGPSVLDDSIKAYNRNLYMLDQKVKLRKQNMVFETKVTGVNDQGQLLTNDSMARQFDFGEVEWIL